MSPPTNTDVTPAANPARSACSPCSSCRRRRVADYCAERPQAAAQCSAAARFGGNCADQSDRDPSGTGSGAIRCLGSERRRRGSAQASCRPGQRDRFDRGQRLSALDGARRRSAGFAALPAPRPGDWSTRCSYSLHGRSIARCGADGRRKNMTTQRIDSSAKIAGGKTMSAITRHLKLGNATRISIGLILIVLSAGHQLQRWFSSQPLQ